MSGAKADPKALRVQLVGIEDPAVLEAERKLDERGFAIPLQSRALWGQLSGEESRCQALVRDESGEYVATLGFSLTGTRALPGHRILRLETVGEAYASPAGRAIIEQAVAFAKTEPRVLRVVVELECRDQRARDVLRAMLVEGGFVRGTAERVAPQTLELELTPDENTLFNELSRSTRQNVRAAAKQGYALRRITEPGLDDRMNQLLSESFGRTGGRVERVDWGVIRELCQQLPQRSNLTGSFRSNPNGEPELVAFAWAMHHGDRAEYSHGASARIPGVTVRLLTPVLWELILWAKREGATWFDFGGITAGSSGSDDALGGVSDFKRGFSKREISFGEEWVFEPSAVKAGLARLATSTMERLRKRRGAG